MRRSEGWEFSGGRGVEVVGKQEEEVVVDGKGDIDGEDDD